MRHPKTRKEWEVIIVAVTAFHSYLSTATIMDILDLTEHIARKGLSDYPG